MSLKKRADSFRYAFNGVKDLFKSQPNARIHLALATAVVVAGYGFQVSRLEWISLVICISLVLGLEAMNTALEYLTDLVSPEPHPLAGKVKDAAAGAVLLAAAGSVIVGALVFLPKILACFPA
ncbi:MAG: diacylglycerol kinase family protein [Saprospiraceae bacterium]